MMIPAWQAAFNQPLVRYGLLGAVTTIFYLLYLAILLWIGNSLDTPDSRFLLLLLALPLLVVATGILIWLVARIIRIDLKAIGTMTFGCLFGTLLFEALFIPDFHSHLVLDNIHNLPRYILSVLTVPLVCSGVVLLELSIYRLFIDDSSHHTDRSQ